MLRIVMAPLAALLLWPLAGRADPVDVPELGVQLMTLPAAATKPQLTTVGSGSTLTTRLGPAVLSIYRDNAPEPPGSDVATPKYRASLDARFAHDVDSRGQGAPTDVGGHSGWTVVVEARSSGDREMSYTCVTYVIVEQHLYRLAVTASASSGRPPEFDSLVSAIGGVKFEPVQAGAPAAAR
jgi:hypothetical protein